MAAASCGASLCAIVRAVHQGPRSLGSGKSQQGLDCVGICGSSGIGVGELRWGRLVWAKSIAAMALGECRSGVVGA